MGVILLGRDVFVLVISKINSIFQKSLTAPLRKLLPIKCFTTVTYEEDHLTAEFISKTHAWTF